MKLSSKRDNESYRTYSYNLNNLTKSQKEELSELCRYSNNLFNVALYNIRQQYFEDKTYLSAFSNMALCKSNENYKMIPAQTSQQIVRKVDSACQSFFGLLKAKKKGSYEAKVRMPKYREKGGVFGITYIRDSFVSNKKICNAIKEGKLVLPRSMTYKKTYPDRKPIVLDVPECVTNDNFVDVEIVPYNNGKHFKANWRFKIEKESTITLNKDNYLSIDLGLNNFATCVSNIMNPFIIDGKSIKSINQWWNKEKSRLQGIAMHQGNYTTNKIFTITENRNNKVKTYMFKASRYIINTCIENNIGTLIIGSNDGWKSEINIGKRNNQNFVQIPYDRLKTQLKNLCEFYGIDYCETEESYTSKCSFIDNDEMPVYKEGVDIELNASGKRIKRGLYLTANNIAINADVNGAYNIARKHNPEFNYTNLVKNGNEKYCTNAPKRITLK